MMNVQSVWEQGVHLAISLFSSESFQSQFAAILYGSDQKLLVSSKVCVVHYDTNPPLLTELRQSASMARKSYSFENQEPLWMPDE